MAQQRSRSGRRPAALQPVLLLIIAALLGCCQGFRLPSHLQQQQPKTTTAVHATWMRNPLAPSPSAGMAKKETELLEAIRGVGGSRREAQSPQETQARVRSLIAELEAAKGIPRPARAPQVNGKWRLLYTLSDGTASPIQRGFVGSRAVSVFQLIDLDCPAGEEPTVTNLVDFGRLGALKVQALASTAGRPIPGFVPRRGDGRILGLNVFGVSKTAVPASDPDARIDFQFVDAGFDLSVLPFRLPYPVPFRLLGDEVKGWIEVTYLSPRLRISRGNKGTVFVLAKEEEGEGEGEEA